MASAFAKIAALCLVALLLQSTGLLLFALGFFPVKPALNGVSGTASFAPGCDADYSVEGDSDLHNGKRSPGPEIGLVRAQYDRLVFMVIDGLPAEFILGNGMEAPKPELMEAMPFTQKLLSTGSAVGYHAKAASPTVTMPRLKAMTSGAIAGFLDVAYNFNTQALLEDNWIAQLCRAGWRMVMLGDNTWLKLFPNLFERHDGVHSFFVKDTVEVDRNVSRHLDVELTSNNWELLVLHYLGLDHAGHLGGRGSPLMISKLREMDEVIMRIHQTVLSESSSARRTLMVVASDHGMTDSGNHGGATAKEIDALALFVFGNISSAILDLQGFKTWEAFQVDLVPTIALLLGIPIPKNSVGALLSDLFVSLTPERQLKALELNSWQLLRLVHARSPGSGCVNELCRIEHVENKREYSVSTPQSNDRLEMICSSFELALELQEQWKQKRDNTATSDDSVVPTFETVKEAYLQFLRPTSEWLARGSTEKRINFLVGGSCMMLFSTLLFLLGLHKTCNVISKESGHLVMQATPLLLNMIAFGGVLAHAASLGSSSLVEEEQYTWHFLVSTLCVVYARLSFQELGENKQNVSMKASTLTLKNRAEQVVKIGLLLLLGRMLRTWHRSGVNWAHLPDVAKYLESGSTLTVTILRIICVSIVAMLCRKMVLKSLPLLLQGFVVIALSFSAGLIFMYMRYTSTATNDSIWATWVARLIFGVLGGTALVSSFVIPWAVPLKPLEEPSSKASFGRRVAIQDPYSSTVDDVVDGATHAAGQVLLSCWCLLQILLQQPVNAGPVLLLLLELVLALSFFEKVSQPFQPWVPILTMYWLGACGHFSLGNSNTLATVDVAGAYIGLSSHSTILSGILAFCITYGSPLLFMQALLLVKSSRNWAPEGTQQFSQLWLLESFALPVVLPLALNGIVMIVFTGVLLIMQDHLFVWSVFSPKYLYVCMTTFAIYCGTIMVLHPLLSLSQLKGGFSIDIVSFSGLQDPTHLMTVEPVSTHLLVNLQQV
ncbi:unnamed protein product [Calypogeia fissa]